MSEYTEQAENFLSRAKITFEVKFLRYGKMSWDDSKSKNERAIYQINLKRGNRELICKEYGQSIAKSFFTNTYKYSSGKTYTKTFKSFAEAKVAGFFDDFGGRFLKMEKAEIPSAYDYLACVTKYNPEKFSDFCIEFGYDEDSIRARKIYEAAVEEWLDVSSFFTEPELEEIRVIQ